MRIINGSRSDDPQLNDIIRDLLRYHVDFARDGLGNLAFTREGAHSQPRILFHEDITGKEITQTL